MLIKLLYDFLWFFPHFRFAHNVIKIETFRRDFSVLHFGIHTLLFPRLLEYQSTDSLQILCRVWWHVRLQFVPGVFKKKTYVFKHVENTIIFILWKNPSYKLFFYVFTIHMPIFVKIGLFLLSQSGKRQTCSFKIVVLVYIMLISLTQKWSYIA